MDFPFLNSQIYSIGDIVKYDNILCEIVAIGWSGTDEPMYYLLHDKHTALEGYNHLSRQNLKLPEDYKYNYKVTSDEDIEEVFKA